MEDVRVVAIRPGSLEIVPLLALLAVAALRDLRTQRVPNWLTLGGAVVGLIVNLIGRPEPGVLLSVSGWAVGIALLLIPYLLGVMGGGDVKLLGMVGAWGGPGYAFATLVYGALVGGVVAFFLVVWPRPLGRGSLLRVDSSTAGVPNAGAVPLSRRTKRYLAYAPVIAIGGLIAYLVG